MKKNYLGIFIVGILLVQLFGCGNPSTKNTSETVTFTADSLSLIKNPGMGWTIYDDASGPVANAPEFWAKQDTIARKYATTLYIRWRWSDMEPQEGKYAWEHDENFKALVKGATDRGLRLAFRVYVASQDNQYESTPAFVFDAGAKYYMENGVPGKVRSPYPDDAIFREKFGNFIRAFAAQFDDASLVNYVDGYNLGWWGEGHNLQFLDWKNKEATFEWIINLYGSSFKNVPLVITVDSQIGHDLELKYAIGQNGYSIRRDGYASFWMPERQKKLMQERFPQCFIVSECCYWQDRTIESVNKIDQKYNWDSWADYYKQVVDETLETHGNYLDLREPVEAIRWTRDANQQVLRFMQKGGYRILPTQITRDLSVKGKLTIEHAWKNLGVGVLPNNCKAWNYKYKVAFVLKDAKGNKVKRWLSKTAEPSDWINQMEKNYSDTFDLADVDAGKYKLYVGIINKQTQEAEIRLAVHEEQKNNWVLVDAFELN